MNNLPRKIMKTNAARIVELADAFGHLAYNDHGQTVEATLNLSIPCARLVKAEVVTAVADTSDGVNDNAVEDVEHSCANAVNYTIANGGKSWDWDKLAEKLGLDLERAADDSVANALYWASPADVEQLVDRLRATGLNDPERVAPALDRLLAAGRVEKSGENWSLIKQQ